jgi:hypothetical protein
MPDENGEPLEAFKVNPEPMVFSVSSFLNVPTQIVPVPSVMPAPGKNFAVRLSIKANEPRSPFVGTWLGAVPSKLGIS